jgi:hypothetical protein
VTDRLRALTKGGPFVTAHVRRGDHQGFCRMMLDVLSKKDQRNRGPAGCYPTIPEIAARLRAVMRATGSSLVYLAHNADASELAKLRREGVRFETLDSLQAAQPLPGREEMHNSVQGDPRAEMVVDVLVATEGAVFVANAWSTLSANVLEERAARGMDPSSFVYWAPGNHPLWYGREGGEKRPETCLCGEKQNANELVYDWLALP